MSVTFSFQYSGQDSENGLIAVLICQQCTSICMAFELFVSLVLCHVNCFYVLHVRVLNALETSSAADLIKSRCMVCEFEVIVSEFVETRSPT